MDVLSIFEMNWLDFLTWAMVICMGVALIVNVAERWLPSSLFKQETGEIFHFPKTFRKAS